MTEQQLEKAQELAQRIRQEEELLKTLKSVGEVDQVHFGTTLGRWLVCLRPEPITEIRDYLIKDSERHLAQLRQEFDNL